MGTRVVVVGCDGVYNEGTATEAITPGMLVDKASDNTVEANDITGLTRVEVAVENDLFGKGGIDEAYASGDTVLSQILEKGDEFMGLVAASDATAIAYDDYVTAAAGGYVTKGVQATAIGRARSTTTGSALQRVRVVVQ